MVIVSIGLGSLAALLGGLGRRIAGGGFEEWTGGPGTGGIDLGDLPVRIFYAAMIVCAAYLAGGFQPIEAFGWTFPAWLQPIALGIGIWIGTTIPNFSAIDLGKGEGAAWSDLAWLTLKGLLNVAVPVLVAIAGGHAWPWLLAGGLAIGVAYWLGWTIAGHAGRVDFPVGLRGGTQIGEVLTGAAIGAGTFLAFGA